MLPAEPAGAGTLPSDLAQLNLTIIRQWERLTTAVNGGCAKMRDLDRLTAALEHAATAASGGLPGTLPVQAMCEPLTTSQAAAVMGLSEGRVRELARDGAIIARRRGRDWEIDPDAARDYRQRRRSRDS